MKMLQSIIPFPAVIFRFTLTLLLISIFLLDSAHAEAMNLALVRGARKQIGITVSYDPSYRRLEYPRGDVPLTTGVCSDVIIRAYREQGIDLQKLLHEDMAESFESYPSNRLWGLKRTDRNIDHRRVPNLQTFFSRKGESHPIEAALADAKAGDILTWQLPSGVPHIGMVSDRRSGDGYRPLVVHNIGRGTLEEDTAGEFKITGWYRYLPEVQRPPK